MATETTSSTINCTTHPDAVAHYRCDGCQRFLCEECFEEGHKLVFCRHCRERGLPLEPTLPDEKARRVADARSQSYSLTDALQYPFRGSGSQMFWAALAGLLVLSIPSFLPVVGIIAGCIGMVWSAFVLLLLPGALVAIVLGTEQGENELPDWPDLTEFGLRMREVFGFMGAGAVSLLPGIALGQVLGCSTRDLMFGTNPACWLLLPLQLAILVVLWIPTFGSVSVFGEPFFAFRVFSHARALQAFGRDLWPTAAVLLAVLILGQAAAFATLRLPLLGLLISTFTGLYAWFTAAHLIGLLFRAHHDELETIYWTEQ